MKQAATPSLDLECRQLRDAVTRLAEWLDDRRAIDPALQTILRDDLDRALSEVAMLTRAVERPAGLGLLMSVCGQADRLVQGLVSPRDGRLSGQFESSHVRLPLLTGLLPKSDAYGPSGIIRLAHADPSLAPAKATETVGRLMQPSEDPSRRGPDGSVRLALLSLADVIKVLGRCYFSNVAAPPSISVTAEIVSGLERTLSENVAVGAQSGLPTHAVLEIRSYLEERFRHHPMLEALDAAGYWEVFANLAPRATADGRRRLASMLWGGLADFDAVFGDLAQALEALNFSGDVLAAADAIRDVATASAHPRSVLAAATILDLHEDNLDPVAVRSRFGQAVTVPRAVLAALFKEVRLVVEGDTHAVLATTDVLILPTACPSVMPRRSGRGQDVAASVEDPPWLARALIQAKSLFLAELAVAEFELSGVVALAETARPLPDTFAPILSHWVSWAQGATPADRAAVDTGLFIAVAGDLAAGSYTGPSPNSGSSTGLGIAWPALSAFMHNFVAGEDWLQRWSTDLPFDNVFILGAGRLVPDHETTRQFATTEAEKTGGGSSRELATRNATEEFDGGLWLRHVRNTAVALDEALNAADGGTGYLVQSIAAVSYRRAKRRQISARLGVIRRKLTADVSRFLYASNISEDGDWRRRAALATQSKLRLVASGQRLGQLIDALAIAERPLRWTFERVLADWARNGDEDGQRLSWVERLSDVAPPGEEQAAALASRYTRLVMIRWVHAMRLIGNAPGMAGRLGVSEVTAMHLVDELAIAAVRADLSGRITSAVTRVLVDAPGSPSLQASRAAFAASEIIRAHLSVLGFDSPWSPLHPKRRGTLGAPLFERAAVSAASAIANAPAARLTLQFCSDWCEAFTLMTDANIASARGMRFEESEYRELEHLLGLLGQTKSREAAP